MPTNLGTVVLTRATCFRQLSFSQVHHPQRALAKRGRTSEQRLCSPMASKKRTWPRRTEAADPHPPNRRGDRRDNGEHFRAKTSFPRSPRNKLDTAGGDAEERDDDRRLKYNRPLAIDANDIVGDTKKEASDANATNARNHPGTKRYVNGSGHISDTPLRIHADAASPMGQRIGTSTSGVYGRAVQVDYV